MGLEVRRKYGHAIPNIDSYQYIVRWGLWTINFHNSSELNNLSVITRMWECASFIAHLERILYIGHPYIDATLRTSTCMYREPEKT